MFSRHHSATPSCSEASNPAPNRSVSARSQGPRSSPSPSSATVAIGRVRSSDGTTPALPVTTRSRPPTGNSSTSATSAPATLAYPPGTRYGEAVNGTTRAAVISPSASPDSNSPAPAWIRACVASTELVRKGTGATPRPSSSRTTAASRAEAPAPPYSSGMSRPATPISRESVFHRSRSYGWGDSTRLSTAGGGTGRRAARAPPRAAPPRCRCRARSSRQVLPGHVLVDTGF